MSDAAEDIRLRQILVDIDLMTEQSKLPPQADPYRVPQGGYFAAHRRGCLLRRWCRLR